MLINEIDFFCKKSRKKEAERERGREKERRRVRLLSKSIDVAL